MLNAQAYGASVDVFSFALVAYEILTGTRAFSDQQASNYRRLLAEGTRPAFPSDTAPELCKLLTRCWENDPRARPTMAQVVDALRPLALTGGEQGRPMASLREAEILDRVGGTPVAAIREADLERLLVRLASEKDFLRAYLDAFEHTMTQSSRLKLVITPQELDEIRSYCRVC